MMSMGSSRLSCDRRCSGSGGRRGLSDATHGGRCGLLSRRLRGKRDRVAFGRERGPRPLAHLLSARPIRSGVACSGASISAPGQTPKYALARAWQYAHSTQITSANPALFGSVVPAWTMFGSKHQPLRGREISCVRGGLGLVVVKFDSHSAPRPARVLQDQRPIRGVVWGDFDHLA